MTIDEAIKHCEKVAEEKENESQDLEYSKLDWRYEANQCSKCAEEHRQLAEWLKDYKRLKEQEPRWIPVNERLPEEQRMCLVSLKHFTGVRTVGVGGMVFLEGIPHWRMANQSLSLNEIVAWMPLPKNYKPQESEDKE